VKIKQNVNLIFLVKQNLDEHNYRRFSIKSLEKSKINIKFFNLLKILNQKVFYNYSRNSLQSYIYVNIKSLKHLYFELRRLKGTIYLINEAGENYFIISFIYLFLLFKNTKKIKFIKLGSLSDDLYKLSFKDYRNKLFNFNLLRIFNFFSNFIKKKINHFFSPKLFKVISTCPLYDEYYDDLNIEYVKTNSFEYLEYCKFNIYKKKNENYFVFLDQEQEFNFDHKINYGIKPYINKNNYFKNLNNFFDFFEKKFKTKIIIAASPRRNAKFVSNSNRKIYKNLTAKLISRSRGVIAHDSISISYAILGKKPLILIYNNDMKKKLKKVMGIKTLANYLDTILINFDKNNFYDQLKYFKKKINFVNKKKYNNFIKSKLMFMSQNKKIYPYERILKIL